MYKGIYDGSRVHTKVVFGEDSLANLPVEAKMRGKRILLIIDGVVKAKTDLVQEISALLGSDFVAVFDEVAPHCPRKTVLKAAALARAVKPDCLISLGGGSTTDTGKALKLALWLDISNEEGFDQAYRKLKEGEAPEDESRVIPQISLSTTLVGAEYSPGMGITDEATHSKQVFSHPFLQCQTIILDPQLTVYTPPELWLSTGVKFLEHAVGRLSALERHPIVDAAASLSVRIAGTELVRSFQSPGDLAARAQLQVGSWLSQFGVGATSGNWMGLSHALGRQVGSVCGVPHGLSSCVILPLSMDYNAPVCGEGLTIAANALGVDTDGLTGEESGHAAADAVRSLIAQLGLPARLRDIGVKKESLPLISERTMGDGHIGANPRPISGAEEVLNLLEQAW